MNQTKEFCRRCHKELTPDELDLYKKTKFLPLCSECRPKMKKNFEKWKDKFQQLNL